MPKRIAPCLLLLLLLLLPADVGAQSAGFLLNKDDRIAWIGSSSTAIGVWPKTMEFFLRTRHPDLNLTFGRFTSGGGTFATGLKNLDRWLEEFHPTVVFLNYGGNDANAGEKGLAQFKENVEACVRRIRKEKARVVLMTHQAGDVRKAKAGPTLRRKLYAQTLLQLGLEHDWPVLDVFHPLEELQRKQEAKDPSFTILRDSIHLTSEAYIAWGCFLYKGIHAPRADSRVHLNATGAVLALKNCEVDDFKIDKSTIAFTRRDKILPLLPPGPLPPLEHVPLLEYSPYWLQIGEMNKGTYEIRCEGKVLGEASHEILGRGLNLNELVLVSKATAPWSGLVQEIWNGKSLERIGATRWRFEIGMKK